MPLTPETRKLLQQTLKIRGSEVPLHRVIDILATDDGDISTAVNRFRDIRNQDLRRALHYCAELLRSLEAEAGLRPAWEPTQAPGPGKTPAGQATAAAPAPPKPKTKLSAAELRTYEDEEARNRVPTAKVYVDGASKGNPGDAGIGVALMTMDGKKIAQISEAIGTATNNIAEYTALIEALKLAKRMGVKALFALSDSELMVKQMNGIYKIKNPDIFKKVQEAKGLTRQLEKFTISYIAREYNTLADALSTAQIRKKSAPADKGAGADLMGVLPENPDEGATD